jgi:cyd operon protein YbgE
MNAPTPEAPAAQRIAAAPLLIAVLITLVGTVYPPLLADATGKADHGVASLLFWSMSAGFVRGVGFVPRHVLWRWLFSPAACYLTLSAAIALKFLR